MTVRFPTFLSARTAIALFAGATCFVAPAVAQDALPAPVTVLPGGCPGVSLTGLFVPNNYVALSAVPPSCEVGPVIAVFGFAFDLLPTPIPFPGLCSGPCDLNLQPLFTTYEFGFAPAPVSTTLFLPPITLPTFYAQAAVVNDFPTFHFHLTNPVRVP